MRLRVLPGMVLALMLEEPVWAQRLGQSVDDGVSAWRVIAALLFCLILGAAAIFALRYRMGMPTGFSAIRLGRTSGRLKLIESLRLGPQTALHLVDLDGEEMLLSSTPQGVSLIRPDADSATRAEAE